MRLAIIVARPAAVGLHPEINFSYLDSFYIYFMMHIFSVVYI